MVAHTYNLITWVAKAGGLLPSLDYKGQPELRSKTFSQKDKEKRNGRTFTNVALLSWGYVCILLSYYFRYLHSIVTTNTMKS